MQPTLDKRSLFYDYRVFVTFTFLKSWEGYICKGTFSSSLPLSLFSSFSYACAFHLFSPIDPLPRKLKTLVLVFDTKAAETEHLALFSSLHYKYPQRLLKTRLHYIFIRNLAQNLLLYYFLSKMSANAALSKCASTRSTGTVPLDVNDRLHVSTLTNENGSSETAQSPFSTLVPLGKLLYDLRFNVTAGNCWTNPVWMSLMHNSRTTLLVQIDIAKKRVGMLFTRIPTYVFPTSFGAPYLLLSLWLIFCSTLFSSSIGIPFFFSYLTDTVADIKIASCSNTFRSKFFFCPLQLFKRDAG